MKKLYLCLFALMSARYAALAQQKAITPQLSALTIQYLDAYKKLADKQAHLPGYVYKRINNKPYVSAFIKVTPEVDQVRMQALGVFTGTKAGNIWTVQIPVEHVSDLATVTGISFIDLDAPIVPSLDMARKYTKADSAQSGINLPMPMTGKNVVVGVIDAGFDFTHPTLYDTLHAGYRVKKVWCQKGTGTPPSGFSYGSEITDSDAIRAAGYDTAITTHGTHVVGIAAGSGYGSPGDKRFRGMAFESDIVLVGIMPHPNEWINAGVTDVIDGMNYIYTYAAAVGKPAVVNLSWGSSLGPHDGLSLFSQAANALTGPGKIFVCSAGNNGEDTIHLKKTFYPWDNIVYTFVTFSPALDTDNQRTWVDAWGDTGKTFCFNVKLYDGSSFIDSTGVTCIDGTSHSFNLIGTNGDTCFVSMTSVASEYNGKPHMFLSVHSKVHDKICLSTTATDGTVNMWEGYIFPPTGYYGALKNLGYSWAVSGDANMTVSDIGSTTKVTTVGAYTSKASFTNINGVGLGYPGAVVGRIAPFSSFGPTEDGRIKPEITGPGFALASSISSYDTSYAATGTNYLGVINATTIGGRVYPYAMLAGTSMSSPAVAGIVAMMLQMDPTLTPDSVNSIIARTAIVDAITGALPAAGNNTWGHGKINAYKALRYMAHVASVQNTFGDPLDCILYPNPAKGSFTINYTGKTAEELTVEIADMTGRVVDRQQWYVNSGYNSRQMNIAALPKGIYLTKVSSKKGMKVIKTILE